MDKEQIKKDAHYLTITYGKAEAIIYCIGRTEGISNICLNVKMSGDWNTINNWEDKLIDILNHWEEVRKEIENS